MATINAVNTSLSGQTGTGMFAGSTSPTLTTPRIGQINDTNGAGALLITAGASAVNFSELRNSSGNLIGIAATGTTTDLDYNVFPKGTGQFVVRTAATANAMSIFSGTGSQHSTTFAFANTAANRTVTFPDATGTLLMTAGSGGLKSFQIFTSGTAQTYTRPAGITSILVEVIGGGGGGGGSTGGASTTSHGGGGGAGGYARLWVASASSSYTYTVGAGGTAGTAGANAGGAGGTTTFSASSLQATGGAGGSGMGAISNSSASASPGGDGGVGSNGDFNVKGQPGMYSMVVTTNINGALGGSSHYGGGAVVNLGGAGNTGGNYGSGGSGGFSTTVSAAGGAGSAGLIIVWEFA